MIVKEWKPIKFDNAAKVIVDFGLLEEAIRWKSDKPVTRIKRIFMHGRYPAISIYGAKYHVHRLLMCFVYGRWLNSDEHVDHIDGNRLNARLENLRVLGAPDHLSITHKDRKQSKEHVYKRISATVKTRYGTVYENPEMVK